LSSPINRGVFREAKREEIKKKKGENRKGKLERKKKREKNSSLTICSPQQNKDSNTYIFTLPFYN
jgi:hypothetical protein